MTCPALEKSFLYFVYFAYFPTYFKCTNAKNIIFSNQTVKCASNEISEKVYTPHTFLQSAKKEAHTRRNFSSLCIWICKWYKKHVSVSVSVLFPLLSLGSLG